MFSSKLLYNPRYVKSYCRQYAMQCYFKRCYSVENIKHVAGMQTHLKRGKKKPVIDVTEMKEVILHFFNNCDKVTMNKLITFRSRLFKPYDFRPFLRQFNNFEDRFKDIDDFVQKTGVGERELAGMALAIKGLKELEDKSYGLNFFYPKFGRENTESIDKVVVLDIFHKDIAWCVRNTADDYITDIGFLQLNLPDAYNHVVHHAQILRFLDKIPLSEVYLMRTSAARGRSISKQGSRYAIHQGVMEAMFITLLNERHGPLKVKDDVYQVRTDDNTNATVNSSDSVKGMARNKMSLFENRVYLFEPDCLRDFYTVTFQKELLAGSKIFQDWYLDNDPIIEKWGLNDPVRKELFYLIGTGQVSVCTLMSDVFCRTLRKKHRQFPNAYS